MFDARRIVGFGSVALLAVGCFVPLFTAPVIGAITFYGGGSGDGIFVLGLAFVSLVLISLGAYRWLYASVGLTLALCVFTLIDKWDLMNTMHEQSGRAGSVEISWGWGVLALGLVLGFACAFARIWRKP